MHTAPEIEITRDVLLSADQDALLDMHSFLNIMNVLLGELELLGMGADDAETLSPVIALADALKNSLDPRKVDEQWARHLHQLSHVFDAALVRLLERRPALATSADATESIANIHSVLCVLEVRTDEYLARRRDPLRWVMFDAARLHGDFMHFLAAVERNSKGRYRIIFNIAAQEQRDYVVNLKIGCADNATLTMPRELQDVLRDLIANARKYTRPGGVITAGLFENEDHLRIVVEDTGVGIPHGELERVVEFGYRASNVSHLATKGGGFGLSKVWLITRALGGRMWIRSAVNVGTRVTVDIPRPAVARGGEVDKKAEGPDRDPPPGNELSGQS